MYIHPAEYTKHLSEFKITEEAHNTTDFRELTLGSGQNLSGHGVGRIGRGHDFF